MTGPITIIMDGAYLIKSLLFVDFEFRERELKEMGWQYITQTTSILREHAAASVLYVRVNKPIITNLYFLFI